MGMAAAMIPFAGCQKNEIDGGNYIVSEGSTFELVADIAQTKTTLDGLSVEWEEGDVVYLVTSCGTWGKPYAEDNSGASIADFVYADGKFTTESTIADSDDPYTFKAMYAAASQRSYHRGASSTHKLSATQNQDCSKPTAHIKENDALVGTFTATTPMTEAAKVTMSHLYTMMQVNVKNSTGAAIEVKKFEMTAADADLAAVFNVTAFDTPAITTKSGASSTITVNVTGGNLADGGSLPVYFVMAPLAAYSGDVTFKVTDTKGNTYTKTAKMNSISFNAGEYNTTSYTISVADVVEPVDENTDVLTRAFTGIDDTSYSSWSGKTSNTSAVYAGQSAGGNDAIQLRSNNNNSGIITTSSGGFAKIVEVTWNSNTSDGRTLQVYGKAVAYGEPEELYNTSTQGTLLGTIVKGTSTKLEIDGNYEYIGMRSASGAMYIDEILVTWSDEQAEVAPLSSISVSGYKTEFAVGETFVFDGVVTATYTDGTSKNVAPTEVSSPSMDVAGNPIVTITYTEGEVTKTFEYQISVTESSEKWIQVTSLSEIVTGEYVIVAKTSTKAGYLPSTTTSSAPSYTTTGLSINGNVLASVTDDMKFTFTVNSTDNVVITNAKGNKLYLTNNNNGVRVGSTNISWKITNHDSNGAFVLSATSTKTRYLGVYNNQDWRCYDSYKASNFTSNTGSSAIYLFKKN